MTTGCSKKKKMIRSIKKKYKKWLILLSYFAMLCWDKQHDPKQTGRRIYLAYISISLSIVEGSWSRDRRRILEGGTKAEAMKDQWVMACSL